MHSHNLPLLAVLWLPAALALLGRVPWLRRRWDAVDSLTRVIVVLLATTAAVHLALIPEHLTDRVTAALFGLDFGGLVLVALAALVPIPGWRAAAAALLLGGIGAYVVYLATGREHLDLTGIATKTVEIAALELLVISGRVRRGLPRLVPAAAQHRQARVARKARVRL